MLLVYNDFEWDLREAAACLTTHGVSFREASTVFADENVILSEDPASGRLRAVGRSFRGRMLVVLHHRGRRIQILGATLHTSGAAEVVAPEPVAAELVAAEPVAPQPVAATGWTAETYGIYWDAYSAARQAARREGKSPREAQRLGREAGERAIVGRAGRSPKRSARSST
jgi:uncharacterized DUF497 family protein